MSNCMKMHLLLFWVFLNQFITASESCHWFTDDHSLTFVFIFSINKLLALSVSLFAGFISVYFGFDLKFSLWSFMVINAFVLAKQSTLSLISNSSAIALVSLFYTFHSWNGGWTFRKLSHLGGGGAKFFARKGG